jgi:hypothetical protein
MRRAKKAIVAASPLTCVIRAKTGTQEKGDVRPLDEHTAASSSGSPTASRAIMSWRPRIPHSRRSAAAVAIGWRCKKRKKKEQTEGARARLGGP